MRTDPANCGGGDVVASQTGIMTKSQQDVEAAFAIAQLSEQEPRARMDSYLQSSYRAGSPSTNGCSSPNTVNTPRFSHMRTAVMPHVSSRVERVAVKRRFDSLNGERVPANSYKQARLEDMVDPVQRAIESERDTFMTSKRQQLARTDAVDEELVGRFVRTCGPSDRDDVQRQLYVKVSENAVSPTFVSSLAASTSTQRSDCDRPTTRTQQTDLPHSVPVPHRHKHHDLNSTVYRWDTARTRASKRHVYRQQIPAVLMSYQDSIESLTRPGSLQWPVCEADSNRSSLARAYYSLGKSAAAAAASQLLSVKRPSAVVSNCPVQLTSGQSHLTTAQSRLQGRVDSCTLRKVRRGEFGALRTLHQYCSQLRRHSAPVSSSDVVKQSEDDEVAVDLSMRKQRLSTDDDVGSAWYRSSRSCGSSPSVTLTVEELPERRHTVGQLTQRSTVVDHQLHRLSSISLPSSPYCMYRVDERHVREPCHQGRDNTDDDDDDSRTHSDVSEADRRLPLKKRRLHYSHNNNHHHHHHHHHQQQQQQCVVSAGDCDKWISTDCTDNRRQCHGQCVLMLLCLMMFSIKLTLIILRAKFVVLRS